MTAGSRQAAGLSHWLPWFTPQQPMTDFFFSSTFSKCQSNGFWRFLLCVFGSILMILNAPVIVVSKPGLSVQKQSRSWADGLLYYHSFIILMVPSLARPNPTFPRDAGLEEISAAVLLSVCLLHAWQIHFEGKLRYNLPRAAPGGG